MKFVLMYGKETLSFDEVVGQIISEERRMKSGESNLTNSMMTVRSGHMETGTIERMWYVGNVESLGM